MPTTVSTPPHLHLDTLHNQPPPTATTTDKQTDEHSADDQDAETKTDSDRLAESRHFREVYRAFATYEEMAMTELMRIDRNLNSLKPAEKALLAIDIPKRLEAIKEAIAVNQSFVNLLISQDLELTEDDKGGGGGPILSTDPIEPGCVIEDNEVSSMNMYRVRSTLKQFAREWSAERAEERNVSFVPLIQALHKYLPLNEFMAKHGRRPRVLSPGSGLGRLPCEVIKEGYSCQGNEFSYFMLLGSNFILNHILEPQSLSIQPFCLNSSNRRGNTDHLQVIKIPDVSAADFVTEGIDFSMCAGDFVEVYATQKGAWDAVLTCFFIDTANNVILYIHTIANILPTGGLWANFGPLLYHFADSVSEMSIELPWEELRSIIERYFNILEEKWIDSFYTTPPTSMLQALYHCVHFRAIRNDVPVDPEFLQ